MNTETHPAARTAFLAQIAARTAIGEQMARAILSGTGAVVDVTLGRARQYIVSGHPVNVAAAAEVMLAAGLTLDSCEYDTEIGETFAVWMSS